MFEWLFRKNKVVQTTQEKKIDLSNFTKEKCKFNISNEVLSILEKWNKINQTNFSISDLFSMLQLDGHDFVDVKFAEYPIYDDVWKIPGYISSFRFDICLNSNNALNEYSKKYLDEMGENNNVRHFVHLCKDGLVLSMDYKLKTKDFRKSDITYNIVKKESDYELNKTNEYSLIILEPNSVYASIFDTIVCERFKDKDGYYVININERYSDDIYTKNIKFKLKSDVEFDFPKEKELMKKLGNKSVSFPDAIMAIIVNYLKKYNLEADDIKIDGINDENKVVRSVSYKKINDNIHVNLNMKKDDIDHSLKTVDVSLVSENDYYVRVFTIKTAAGRDMRLKVYYNNLNSVADRDFNVIDYFMGYFPVGLIDNGAEWYPFDIHFRLLCQSCFSNNMNCIDKITLEYFEINRLVDSREWKRYNLEQDQSCEDNPVLKRK